MEVSNRKASFEHLKSCHDVMKYFCWEKCKKAGFWSYRNKNSKASARRRQFSLVLFGSFLPTKTSSIELKQIRWCLSPKMQKRPRSSREKRQMTADCWKQFVFTDKCRFKLRSGGRVGVRRIPNDRCNPLLLYHPQKIFRRSFFGLPSLERDGAPHQ